MAPHLLAIGRACRLVIFGFTVATILDSSQWASLPRDLDLAELWAGVGNVALAGRQAGHATRTFEKKDDLADDLLTPDGFLRAVTLVMRLRPGGLLGTAPTCSSFGFANSHKCRRSKTNWAGDVSYEAVQRGNLEAQVAVFLVSLAVARGAHAFLENPAGSCMFSFLESLGSLAPLRALLRYQVVPRCAYSTEPLGTRYFKPYKFMATGPWITAIARKCPCPDSQHTKLMDTDAAGGVTGNEHMPQSQAYPIALGQALVSAWSRADWAHSSPDSFLPGAPGVSLSPSVQAAPAVAAARRRPPACQEMEPRSPGPWEAGPSAELEVAASLASQARVVGGPASPPSPGPWAVVERSGSPGPWARPVATPIRLAPGERPAKKFTPRWAVQTCSLGQELRHQVQIQQEAGLAAAENFRVSPRPVKAKASQQFEPKKKRARGAGQ